jgi:hypothetical protein
MVTDEILKGFIEETRVLITEMQSLLETAEEGLTQAQSLETFGQRVDRIMGGARTLASNIEGPKGLQAAIHQLADYAAVGKAVGYKASQLKDNAGLYTICVALLLDATDVMSQIFS